MRWQHTQAVIWFGFMWCPFFFFLLLLTNRQYKYFLIYYKKNMSHSLYYPCRLSDLGNKIDRNVKLFTFGVFISNLWHFFHPNNKLQIHLLFLCVSKIWPLQLVFVCFCWEQPVWLSCMLLSTPHILGIGMVWEGGHRCIIFVHTDKNKTLD